MPQRPAKKRKSARRKTGPELFFEFENRFWHGHWKEAVLIVLMAFGLYSISIPYGYVLDDQIVITDNQFTKKGFEGIRDIFTTESFQGYFGEQKDLVAGARYRPLSIATFAVETGLWGLNPHRSHAINILMYALTGLLLFRIIAVLLPRRKVPWYLGAGFVGALFFAAHPVHSEVVANIKGRDEILALFGSLAALYAALRFVSRHSLWWLGFSGFLMAFALFSKENAITMLAVVPVTLWIFSKRLPLKTYLMVLSPLIAVTAGYLLIRYQVVGYLLDKGTPIEDLLNNPFLGMSIPDKYATIVYTLGLYVKLLFIPHPLTHDYYPYHIPIMDWAKPGTLLSFALYLALGAAAFYGLLKKQVYAYGVLVFLITLSIASNLLFPVGTFMNERFLYMPSVGFCFLLGYAVQQSHGLKGGWKHVAMAGLGIYLSLFCLRTITRVPAWKDALSLNEAAVSVSKNSARANCFMGTALYNLARSEKDLEVRRQLVERASAHVDKALSIIPDYYSANQMKSGLLAEQFHLDRDLGTLLAGFKKILAIKPNVEYIGQYAEYLNRLTVDHQALLDFYFEVGYEIMYKRHRRYDYAIKYLNYGLSKDGNDPRLNLAMGKAYQAFGDPGRAGVFLEKATRLEPTIQLE